MSHDHNELISLCEHEMVCVCVVFLIFFCVCVFGCSFGAYTVFVFVLLSTHLLNVAWIQCLKCFWINLRLFHLSPRTEQTKKYEKNATASKTISGWQQKQCAMSQARSFPFFVLLLNSICIFCCSISNQVATNVMLTIERWRKWRKW